jgi:3-oxoacyl-[acyl-carrier-protein] synthase II
MTLAGYPVLQHAPITSSSRPRAVVTGWYLGWPHGDRWLERHAGDSAASAQFLRASCEAGFLVPARDLTPEWQLARGAGATRFDVATRLACAELARIGLRDKSGLTVEPSRVGVSFSSSKGELALLHQPESASSCLLPWTPDAAAHFASTHSGAHGPILSPVAACATGAHSVALGAQLIQDGYADVVVSGAIEMGLTPLVMAGYSQLGALSKSGVMRPFDRNRDGFVPQEGVAVLVLEREETARRRGAPLLGYIGGWSMHGDATSMTAMVPSGDTIARAVEQALRMAQNPQVDYINAHGTATALNDIVESRAVKQVFGKSVAISSTKALSGHWLGAAGALEAILCVQAMREDFVPPTLNLTQPDAQCDLHFVPQVGHAAEIRCALSLSYGFGGHIGALVLQNGDG